MPQERTASPGPGRVLLAAAWLLAALAGPALSQSPPPQEPDAEVVSAAETPIPCPYCDMRGADLSGQDLTDLNLTGANLAGANFKGAILNGVALIGADLSGANFDNAKLNDSAKGHADLSRANLTGASFQGAEMNGTNLQFAEMGGADFSHLDLTRAVLGARIKAGAAGGRKTSFREARLRRGFAVDAAAMDAEGVRWEPAEAAAVTAAEEIACGRADLSGLTSRVYVSSTGTDSGTCGASYSSPCKTIGFGIGRCAASGCGVLVAWDEYRLADTLALRDGVNVYGGCLPSSQARPDYFSAVIAPAGGKPAASASAIKGAILQGFQLNASAASGTTAATSVALLVKDSSGLSVLDTEVVANRGAQGTLGSKGADGAAGGKGSGRDGGTVGSCSFTTGGAGAVRREVKVDVGAFKFTCKPSCSSNGCAGFGGRTGTTGVSAGGGSRGNDNCTECPQSRGKTGDRGGDGRHASCGGKGVPSGNVAGSFSGDNWVASTGGSGTTGGDGGGGGGGGSGGYKAGACFWVKTEDDGNTGGGGGAGGCRGGVGVGGQQGGASFALLALRSAVALTRSELVAGIGGNGANGGPGGRGGAGGSGAGGASNLGGGYGGPGGTGGAGGASGGGAGGNGGPAVGAALAGGSTINGSALVYYPGQSGIPGEGGAGGTAIVGGACTAANGDNGVKGLVADSKTY